MDKAPTGIQPYLNAQDRKNKPLIPSSKDMILGAGLDGKQQEPLKFMDEDLNVMPKVSSSG